ncbi:MAG: hypothetical protein N4A76_14560 [Firmicutes bacterium]|jgi:hypothetical protein|nr:hypothetical protein [Bacillota bacterium]
MKSIERLARIRKLIDELRIYYKDGNMKNMAGKYTRINFHLFKLNEVIKEKEHEISPIEKRLIKEIYDDYGQLIYAMKYRMKELEFEKNNYKKKMSNIANGYYNKGIHRKSRHLNINI